MNHAPHLYFAWQQLVEKSQLMLRLARKNNGTNSSPAKWRM
ncbi:flagellar protein FliT [Escherichia coli]|uniref:Flagellar protein FliT n=1 Tax=Escherichia coli TaxID=562 RepID=A0A376U7U1_ECOLX|nr:flagellar protein FliT [Escherichia coli]